MASKIEQIFVFGVIALLLVISGSCAPAVKTTTLSDAVKSKPEDCEPFVYSPETGIPDGAETLGTISIKDAGFSVKCDYYTVLNYAKAEACKLGADVIKIIKVKEPSFWGSSCYQIEAVALAVEDAGIELKKYIISGSDRWVLETPFLNESYPNGTDYQLLCSMAGDKIEKIYLALYVVATRSDVFPIYRHDKWYDLKTAVDDNGTSLELEKGPMEIGHVNAELYSVVVGMDYLESHMDKPIEIKLTGEGGDVEVNISPRDVAGFLNALPEYLVDQQTTPVLQDLK